MARTQMAGGAALLAVAMFGMLFSSSVAKTSIGDAQGLYAMEATDIDGKTVDLSQFQGNVAIVVNVASN